MKATILIAAAALAFALSAQAQTTIGGCKIEPKAKCAKAKLVRADLKGAKLSGADLSGADLQAADLSNADLSNANLQGANLMEAQSVGTLWTGANLSGASWMVGRDSYGNPVAKTCAPGSIGACK
jgi:uncharacterized protein YjbI with pentapeptide repeats